MFMHDAIKFALRWHRCIARLRYAAVSHCSIQCPKTYAILGHPFVVTPSTNEVFVCKIERCVIKNVNRNVAILHSNLQYINSSAGGLAVKSVAFGLGGTGYNPDHRRVDRRVESTKKSTSSVPRRAREALGLGHYHHISENSRKQVLRSSAPGSEIKG
ncbi:hypothetical protein EVAR_97177_1 [Eumeta japonica]|uniref:Uncharacterized protein n=1 Tax=Eumeta variegata TaxID=151549 RepID=A0A4C1TL15_EUMVA|nr:hypothetical protein EVAR_97177_1 [Eumeta japonica]